MKIRADEHVSVRIVEFVRDLTLSPGTEFDSVHEAGHAGSSDAYWISKFATDGGEAILSADRDFLSLEPQILAIFETGLKVIHLPPKWGQAPGFLQAAHILQWWPRIEATIKSMKGRECYRPEWNISESGRMKQIKIDFAKAHKRQRRAKRRSAKT